MLYYTNIEVIALTVLKDVISMLLSSLCHRLIFYKNDSLSGEEASFLDFYISKNLLFFHNDDQFF